jgi:hypothetical protein
VEVGKSHAAKQKQLVHSAVGRENFYIFKRIRLPPNGGGHVIKKLLPLDRFDEWLGGKAPQMNSKQLTVGPITAGVRKKFMMPIPVR